MTEDAVPWDEILRLYADGTNGPRELQRIYGVHEATIRTRAKREGITPDQRRRRVAERVQQKLDADGGELTAEAVENRLVQTGTEIVHLHRGLITRGVNGVTRLLDELNTVSEHRTQVVKALEVICQSAQTGEAVAAAAVIRDVVADAVNLGGRAKAAQALSGALKNLIGLQRQAFNLPSAVTPEGTASADSTLRSVLDEIDGADTGFAG